MNNPSIYEYLRFEDQRPSRTQRLIFIGSVVAGFTLLWVFGPHGIVFWLTLLALGILSWIASFGCRQALATLHNFIHHLEGN